MHLQEGPWVISQPSELSWGPKSSRPAGVFAIYELLRFAPPKPGVFALSHRLRIVVEFHTIFDLTFAFIKAIEAVRHTPQR